MVASANVTLHEFLAELGRRGKSVTATGGTDHQTLAGLISTGTAPASSRHALYELLEWVELVTVDAATGHAVERRISRGDADFPAAVCSLGLLGVLTRVRFRLVDELYFSVVQKIVDLDDVLADLDATSAKYDFWRVNWVPKSEKALLWAATAVPREQSKPDGDYPTDQSEQVLDVVFKVLDKLADTGPLLTGALELVYDVLALTYRDEPRHRPAAQHAPGGPARAAARGDGRVELPAAGRAPRARRVPGATSTRHGWPNIPTEIELTRVDGSLMSAWNWDGLPYIVKFNFMYLTEVCTEPGEKEAIYAHLRGLWEHLRSRRRPVQGALGEDQLHRPRVRAAEPRVRRVPAADLADVHERLPGGADRAGLAVSDDPAGGRVSRADRHPRPPGDERVPLGPRPAPPLLDRAHVRPAGQPHRLQDAGEGRGEGAVVVAAHPRARATSAAG